MVATDTRKHAEWSLRGQCEGCLPPSCKTRRLLPLLYWLIVIRLVCHVGYMRQALRSICPRSLLMRLPGKTDESIGSGVWPARRATAAS